MPEASFNLSHTWVFPRFTAPGPFHDTADDDDDDVSMPAGMGPHAPADAIGRALHAVTRVTLTATAWGGHSDEDD